jgi:hypothetical protein
LRREGRIVAAVLEEARLLGIRRDGFRDCRKLALVSLPAECETIAAFSFMGCDGLVGLGLDLVTEVQAHAFDGLCSSGIRREAGSLG